MTCEGPNDRQSNMGLIPLPTNGPVIQPRDMEEGRPAGGDHILYNNCS